MQGLHMREKFRKFLKNKRKFDKVLFIAPIACALFALLLFSQDRAAFAAAWRSPVAWLADRAPGLRDSSALYSTKPGHQAKSGRRVKSPGVLPAERVLAATRERENPLADLFPPELSPFDFSPGAPSLGDDLGLPGFGTPSFASSSPFPFSGGGGFPGIGGGPGTPQDGVDTPTDVIPDTPRLTEVPRVNPPPSIVSPPIINVPPPGGDTTTPPAVPEPSTWAMMILGFGTICSAMRRSRPGLKSASLKA